VAESHKRDLARFGISFDHFHSTHSPENVELTSAIFLALQKAGFIETKTIEQFFDPVKKMFLPDRYIKGECPKCGTKDQYGDSCENCGAVYAPTDLKNPFSALTGAKPVLKKSDHFFFKLSDPRCVEFLRGWTQDGRLQPEVANKVLEWLDGGLNDWDITRDTPYFGIEIPGAKGKYFYTWLDAPIGYLASLRSYLDKKGLDFEKYLADPKLEQIHFIGKDIIYFHTLFWPAVLKFAERKVPDRVYVHGFLQLSGEKMSKSRGVTVSPQKYLDMGLNPEWVRYYLAAKLNDHVEDLDFNPDDFLARVNSDLVGKYVNIASRAAGFIGKRFAGKLSEEPLSGGRELKHKMRGNLAAPAADDDQAPQILFEVRSFADAIAADYEAREFGKALRPDHVPRRPGQPVHRRAEAVGDRQGARSGRRAAVVLHALPRALPHPHGLPEAGAAEGGRGRRGVPGPEAPCLGRRRHAVEARPHGAGLSPPRLAHRSEADRPAAGTAAGRQARCTRRRPQARATRPSSSSSPSSPPSRR
jgi:methionyl-tRNA synthetase